MHQTVPMLFVAPQLSRQHIICIHQCHDARLMMMMMMMMMMMCLKLPSQISC
jgi:hypothetical protein